MAITVITDKNIYVFDNAQEIFIDETNLSIRKIDEEFVRGLIIEEDKNTD